MIDLNSIRQAAQVVTDQKGEPMVQVPLPIWEKVIAQLEADVPQHIRFQEFLKKWENYHDDASEQWWDEFDAFLRANRLNFPEQDFGLGDE